VPRGGGGTSLSVLLLGSDGDVVCASFSFQDILDEMRKELSKLKEELIDGSYHGNPCSPFTHTLPYVLAYF